MAGGDAGALLREARLAAGLTQADLAARLGVTRQWVNQVEHGHATGSFDTMLTAMRTCGLTVSVNPAPGSALLAGKA